MRAGGAAGLGFGGDVHHPHAARGIVVRELFHLESTRISSPFGYSPRSGSATRKALARVRAGMSPEPCHPTGVTSAPSALTRAGRKRVSPARCLKSRVRRAKGMNKA